MENNDSNSNWTPPTGGQGGTNELPDAKSGFTFGLIGLILSPICCCGISGIGIVLSIIGLIKSGKAAKTYEGNPGSYDEAMYKKAKTAKILAIIGLIVGIIGFGYFIFSMIVYGANGMNYERMMRKYR